MSLEILDYQDRMGRPVTVVEVKYENLGLIPEAGYYEDIKAWVVPPGPGETINDKTTVLRWVGSNGKEHEARVGDYIVRWESSGNLEGVDAEEFKTRFIPLVPDPPIVAALYRNEEGEPYEAVKLDGYRIVDTAKFFGLDSSTTGVSQGHVTIRNPEPTGHVRALPGMYILRKIELYGKGAPFALTDVEFHRVLTPDSPNIGMLEPLPNGEIRTTSSTGAQKGVKPERYDLIPVEAMTLVARLYGKGAEKYAEHNWRAGYEWSKSYAALQRHATQFWAGEDIDEEMQLPHLASVVFHALALMTFMIEHPEFDNRYIPKSARVSPEVEKLLTDIESGIITVDQAFELFGLPRSAKSDE